MQCSVNNVILAPVDWQSLVGTKDTAGLRRGRPRAARLCRQRHRRVTCGTELDRQDVSLGVRQGLLRHSDPRLTANTYTKPQDADRRAAVDTLDFDASRPCPPLGPEPVSTSQNVASRCTTSLADGEGANERKSLATREKQPDGGEEKVEAPSGIEPDYADLQSAA